MFHSSELTMRPLIQCSDDIKKKCLHLQLYKLLQFMNWWGRKLKMIRTMRDKLVGIWSLKLPLQCLLTRNMEKNHCGNKKEFLIVKRWCTLNNTLLIEKREKDSIKLTLYKVNYAGISSNSWNKMPLKFRNFGNLKLKVVFPRENLLPQVAFPEYFSTEKSKKKSFI